MANRTVSVRLQALVGEYLGPLSMSAVATRKLEDALSDLDRTAVKTGRSATMAVSGMAAGFGAVPGVAGAATGAVLLGAAAMTTAAGVAGTLKMAVKGVGDAMSAAAEGDAEALQEALDKLSPSARRFVYETRDVVNELDDLQQKTQESFFEVFNGSLRMATSQYLPMLNRQLPELSTELGRTARGFVTVASSADNVKRVGTILESTGTSTRSLGRAVESTTTLALRLASAGGPALERTADLIADLADRAEQAVARAEASGRLDRTFDMWADSAEGAANAVSPLVSSLGNLFSSEGAAAGAQEFFSILTTGTTAVGGLVNAFADLPPGVQQTIVLMGSMGLVTSKTSTGVQLLADKLTNLSGRMSDIPGAGGKASSTIGTLGGVVGRAAIPVGLLAAGWLLLQNRMDKTAAKYAPQKLDLEDLIDSMRRLNSTGVMTGEVLKATGGSWEAFGRHIVDSQAEVRKMQLVQQGVLEADWSSPAEGATRYRDAIAAAGQATSNLTQVGQALAEMYKRGDTTQAATTYLQVAEALQAQGVAASQIKHAMKDYLDISGGLTVSQYQMATATNEARLAQQLLNGNWQDAIDKVGSLSAAFDALNGKFLTYREAEIAAEEGTDRLTEALKKSKGSLDENTEAGRDAEKALLDQTKRIQDAVQAKYNEVAATGDVRGAVKAANETYQEHRQALIDAYVKSREAAVGHKQAREEAEKLADQYLKMPRMVETTLRMPGLQGSLADMEQLNRYLVSINGKTVTTTVRVDTRRTGPVASLNRYGGVYQHAEDGLLRDPAIFTASSGNARYAFAEPATGGEAFVPRFGPRERALRILDHAAQWHGSRVVPDRGGRGDGVTIENLHLRAYSDRFSLAQVQQDLAMRGVH